jgi:hypothetical protein
MNLADAAGAQNPESYRHCVSLSLFYGLIAGLKSSGNDLAKRNGMINSQNMECLFHIGAIDISVSFPVRLSCGAKNAISEGSMDGMRWPTTRTSRLFI